MPWLIIVKLKDQCKRLGFLTFRAGKPNRLDRLSNSFLQSFWGDILPQSLLGRRLVRLCRQANICCLTARAQGSKLSEVIVSVAVVVFWISIDCRV